MTLVEIPFLPEWKEAMLSGEKRATVRRSGHGVRGDVFEAFGAKFLITEVVRVPLSTARNCYWSLDGCGSAEHFERVWKRIHPRAGYRPNQPVSVHMFQRVA